MPLLSITITISGQIRIECSAEVAEGDVLQGKTVNGKGNAKGVVTHLLETMSLPEALKKERKEVFMGEAIGIYPYKT